MPKRNIEWGSPLGFEAEQEQCSFYLEGRMEIRLTIQLCTVVIAPSAMIYVKMVHAAVRRDGFVCFYVRIFAGVHTRHVRVWWKVRKIDGFRLTVSLGFNSCSCARPLEGPQRFRT